MDEQAVRLALLRKAFQSDWEGAAPSAPSSNGSACYPPCGAASWGMTELAEGLSADSALPARVVAHPDTSATLVDIISRAVCTKAT